MHRSSKLLALGLVAILLGACGGGGGSGGGADSGAISASINALVKHHDCSKVASSFRAVYSGASSVSACSHALAQRTPVKSLSIGTITVNGNKASAQVTADGQTGTVTLVKQGGQWLISDIHR